MRYALGVTTPRPSSLAFLLLLIAACRPGDPGLGGDGGDGEGGSDGDADADEGPFYGAVHPYFVEPPSDRTVENRLIELVDGAEESIDLAAYVLDHEGFVEALERAAGRGVRLRVVSDSEVGPDRSEWAFDRLEAAGAELTLQRDDGFASHNKFMVVDGRLVWMGSTNFSETGLRWNNNASLLIESEEVAADFTRELEQMLGGRFGTRKSRTDDIDQFVVEGVQLQTLFAPQERPDEALVTLCDRAETHIFFMIYLFTLDEMEAALVRAARRGVAVRGVIDEEFARDAGGAALVARLRAGGVEVTPDVNLQGVFHHKVLIVDPQGDAPTVAVGSGNWTYSFGHGNDESYVLVRDRLVVRAFYEELLRWL